jgi:hypothetical protein
MLIWSIWNTQKGPSRPAYQWDSDSYEMRWWGLQDLLIELSWQGCRFRMLHFLTSGCVALTESVQWEGKWLMRADRSCWQNSKLRLWNNSWTRLIQWNLVITILVLYPIFNDNARYRYIKDHVFLALTPGGDPAKDQATTYTPFKRTFLNDSLVINLNLQVPQSTPVI